MHLHRRSPAGVVIACLTATLIGCEEPAPPPVDAVRPVKLMDISASGSGITREYPGRIKAGQYSEMSFEVPGKVTEFIYKEGTPVEDGGVLARLDPRDYQADYDAAYARLQHSKSERDRYKEMYDQDVKPYSEYEMKLRMYEVDEANLRQAQKALDDTVLRAPFDGVMARKLVEVFENVLAKQPVLVMQNDDLLEIKVSVPERDLANGRAQRLPTDELTRILSPRVIVSPLPDREFPAWIKEIANVADPATRTFEATFLFDNVADVNILGGMTAKIVIEVPLQGEEGGVMIPSTATVARSDGQPIVWVVDRATMTAESRDVELGDMRGGSITILSGLSVGDTIAISGVDYLTDGMTVRELGH